MQYRHLLPLALAAFASAQGNGTQPQDLNSTLAGIPELSNLTTFLNLSPELLGALGSAQDITVLAPSDAAFAQLTQGSGGAALADSDLVSALLLYHVLNGTVTSSQITNTSTFVPTLLTNQTYTNVTGGQVVEAVLIGDQAVFFSGLLQNATVSQADVNFTGGVIHVIDSVLTLPVGVTDTAVAAGLTALYGAINSTDLIETVDTTPDVTIFAPVNEAFQDIGSALANISQSDLANVLAYHVVNGSVAYSSNLQNGSSVQTLNGGNLTITIEDGTVFVNAAQVLIPNILVANGVVHVIDNVLNPSNTDGPQESATEGAPGFSATPGTDVPFTSGVPEASTTINVSSEGPGPASTTIAQSSSSTAAAAPMKTGAVGMGALLGAGAAVFFV